MSISPIKWKAWKLIIIIIFIYVSRVILEAVSPMEEISYKLHFNPISFIGNTLIYYVVLLWVYQVASYFNTALAPNLKLDYTKFKMSYWIFVAILFFHFFVEIFIWQIFSLTEFIEVKKSNAFIYFQSGLVIIELATLIHISYFVARSIRTLELKVDKPLLLKDYLLFMVCLLFLKIGGIIFLQSTVNRTMTTQE